MPKGGPSCLGRRTETNGPYLLSLSLHPHPFRARPLPCSRSSSKELSGPGALTLHQESSTAKARCGHTGGGGRRGRGRTQPPASCSKRRARQGRADISRGLSKKPACPVEIGRACRLDVPRALQGMQGPRALWERTRTVGHGQLAWRPAPFPPFPLVTHLAPRASGPHSAVLALAGRHLHFGNSAVGHCLQRAVESQSRNEQRLASKGQLPKLR